MVMVGRQMAIKNSVSSDFGPRSWIVKSVSDCPLSGVRVIRSVIKQLHQVITSIFCSSCPLFCQLKHE